MTRNAESRRRSVGISCVLLCLALALGAAEFADAHEVRPAYLDLRQTGPDTWNVEWKLPARGDARLQIVPRFSPECAGATPPILDRTESAFIERWTVRCTGGLSGRTVTLDGLSATFIDALVRVEYSSGAAQTVRLRPESPSFEIEAEPRSAQVARTYLVLGIEHILLGVDHLLFVLALLLITGPGWRLIKTVTAFTVAHSITLALATLGVVHVPSAPVEAVIALSIVFVAAEILHLRAGHAGITARAPWVVAFTFGLLHGFGFAGALSEVGLPASHIPIALLFFNLGVEAGQLAFVTAALVAWGAFRRLRLPLPRWAAVAPAYAIGGIAMFWVIERVAAFRA